MNEQNTATKYVVITPVRDEERYIRHTIESILSQTVRPREWIIVDDGSTDHTPEIIGECAKKCVWIHIVSRPNRGFRKSGGGVMEAFYDGYKALSCDDWEFVVKLDGDLTFSSDYFERCFENFRRDSRLGIGGGSIFHNLDGRLKLEQSPTFHVRGATKIYRRECWEAIGGLWLGAGWDTIDEVKANMLSWKTHTFANLHLLHHRFTGSAAGFFRDHVKHGAICYITGYHPLFVAASCVRRLTLKPYILGSAATLYGLAKAYFTHMPRVNDKRLIRFVRQQQLRRLCWLQTVWK